MSKREFFKTTFTFTVLSEEKLPDSLTLEQLDYMTLDGGCSGQFGETKAEPVDGPAMAKLLQEQGSDPEFFRLDAEGNDLSEDAA